MLRDPIGREDRQQHPGAQWMERACMTPEDRAPPAAPRRWSARRPSTEALAAMKPPSAAVATSASPSHLPTTSTPRTSSTTPGSTWMAPPSEIGNLEFDVNQVMSDGKTVLAGVQCDGYTGQLGLHLQHRLGQRRQTQVVFGRAVHILQSARLVPGHVASPAVQLLPR